MASINKAIIIGNLGADPELRYTNAGRAVANFRVATNERWKDEGGETQERTEWHQVVAWGKLGEICGKYLKKGRPVYIEGRLQTSSWEDQTGNKRYKTEIIAQTMQMLGSRGEPGEASHGAWDNRSDSQEMPEVPVSSAGNNTDDDLPF